MKRAALSAFSLLAVLAVACSTKNTDTGANASADGGPTFVGDTEPCKDLGIPEIACASGTTTAVCDTSGTAPRWQIRCDEGEVDGGSDGGRSLPVDGGAVSCGDTTCAFPNYCFHYYSGAPRDGGSQPAPECRPWPTGCDVNANYCQLQDACQGFTPAWVGEDRQVHCQNA